MLTWILLPLCLQRDDLSIVHRAIESYGRATSVSGTLECDTFGSKETWTFSIAKNSFSILKTPYRVYSSQSGRYLVYQPFDNTYVSPPLTKDAMLEIADLWLFNGIGNGVGVPPPYVHTKTAPRKVQFGGKSAWEIDGLHTTDAKVEAYLDAETGELLGWDESMGTSEPNRRFQVKSLRYEKGPGAGPFVLPKGARKVSPEALLYLPIGQPVPDAALIDEHGDKTTLTSLLAGQNGAVISVGAPGCGPCEALKRFGARNIGAFNAKKVRLVALESWGCSQSDLESIARDNPVPFRTYRPSGSDDLRYRLKLAGAPTIYLVDAHGRVIQAQQGFEAKSFSKSLSKLHLAGLKQ